MSDFHGNVERIVAEVSGHPNCRADHLLETADFFERLAESHSSEPPAADAFRRASEQLRATSVNFPSLPQTEF